MTSPKKEGLSKKEKRIAAKAYYLGQLRPKWVTEKDNPYLMKSVYFKCAKAAKEKA